MDHWKKVYELGGRLGFVRGLFEFTANHVHYLFYGTSAMRIFLFAVGYNGLWGKKGSVNLAKRQNLELYFI